MLRKTLVRFLTGGFVVAGIAIVAASVGTGGTAGCATHQCDAQQVFVCPSSQSSASYCTPSSDAGIGGVNLTSDTLYQDGVTGELVWDSSPIVGDWLEFRGNETVAFFFPPEVIQALSPPLGDGGSACNAPSSVFTWVSSDPPDADVGPAANTRNFVLASGQLSEITYINCASVDVFNASCADYSIRIEVRVPPPAAATSVAAPDASADAADSSSTDASATDASNVSSQDGSLQDGSLEAGNPPDAAALPSDAAPSDASAE